MKAILFELSSFTIESTATEMVFQHFNAVLTQFEQLINKCIPTLI